MSIEWKIENNNLVVFHVSGQLGKDEYEVIHTELEAIIKKIGQIKILVLLNDFQGWEAVKGWEDTSTEGIDPYISKMAIVGEEKWRDLATVFTLKGLRPVPIEYYSTDQHEAAIQWLNED